MPLIHIRFSIRQGGDLLFLGAFETPAALAQIQMLRDNGAYEVIATSIGHDCDKCEDEGIVNDGIDDHYCGCNLGQIMERVHTARVMRERVAEEVRAMQLEAEVRRAISDRQEADRIFRSDAAIVSVKFDSGREIFRHAI